MRHPNVRVLPKPDPMFYAQTVRAKMSRPDFRLGLAITDEFTGF